MTAAEPATEPVIGIGQVWVAKRDRRRTVMIAWVEDDWRTPVEDRSYGVRRNTSRRTQAISTKTLRRDYRLYSTPKDPR